MVPNRAKHHIWQYMKSNRKFDLGFMSKGLHTNVGILNPTLSVNLRSISSYSVRMWEDTGRKNSEYGHFSHSANAE